MTLKQMIARVMRAIPTIQPGLVGEHDIIDMLNEGQLNLARLSSKITTEETDIEYQTGTVDVALTAITWVSGDTFDTTWTGTIEIDGTDYTIDEVTSTTAMTVTATAGTDTGVTYEIEISPDTVDLPSDLLKLESVYFEDVELSPGVDKVPVEYTYDEDGDECYYGTPTYYYVLGSEIVLRPKPTLEGTVKVAYMPSPTVLTADTDVPSLAGCEEYLIAYTLERIHFEAGSMLWQQWNLKRTETLAQFMETSDQNYQTPFRVIPMW